MTKKQKSIATQKASRVDETKSIDFKLVVSEAKKRLAKTSKTEIQDLIEALEEFLTLYLPDKQFDNIDRLMISLSDETLKEFFSNYDPRKLFASLVISEANKDNLVTAYKGVLFLTEIENERVMGNMKRIYEDEWLPHINRGYKVLKGAKLGHEHTHGTPEDIDMRRKKYHDRCVELLEADQTLGLTKVRKKVADIFDVGYKTVERATPNLRNYKI